MEYHNLFHDFQFGFRPNRSTQQDINVITNILESNSVNRQPSLIVSRDVHKAFDTVWWRGLLYKLYHLPIDDQLQLARLIYNYLDRRKISIKFNGIITDHFQPKAGVPQGSSLGPILYIIYVNDTPAPFYYNTIITRFADDMVHIITSDLKQTKSALMVSKLQQKNS